MTPGPPGPARDAPATSRRFPADLLPAAACVAVGLAMALLPNALWWARTGRPTWIADGDELYYLAVGKGAYFEHIGYLSDPVVDGGASLYRQLPLLPGSWMARALGAGPLGIDLCWRALAGLGVALTWFVLLRHHVGRRWVAALLTVIVLVDCGLLGASLLLRQGVTLAETLRRGTGTAPVARLIHRPWRIATPALTMPYLLLHLWLMARARARPSPARLVLAGAGFGLLFHVYPYYWTAAAVALAMAFVLDAGHRRVYAAAALVGVPIGLPRVVFDVMLKRSTAPDWLARFGKFVTVGRFEGLDVPKFAALLAVLGLAWVWARRRDLIYVWSLGAAGLALYHHQVVTRLQVENYHYMYVWGPCLALLLALWVADVLPARGPAARAGLAGLALVALADAGAGLWLRSIEAFHASQAPAITDACRRYREQRAAGLRLEPRSVVAGDLMFVDLACILDDLRPLDNYWVLLSPYISDPELDRRAALNDLLRGLGPPADPAPPGSRRARRLAAYEAAAADLDAATARAGVRYVALPADRPPPACLTRGWRLLQDGPSWRIWEYERAPAR
ncbi:MAG TPA: hypothetical protein VG406_14325 [Isosphaeraceae bacterium]|jgi:hypothetical protein|nr:hypothetical protein [Isosphaeraceae bacterium]